METAEHVRYQIQEGSDCRVDHYLSHRLGLFTRSQIKQRVIKICVNGRETKLSRKVRPGDQLDVYFIRPASNDIAAEDIPLDILYEDDRVIVVNKRQAMVVHPAKGNRSGTLVNALLYHLKDHARAFAEEPVRPGIVHRLDKDTTGVLIAAKDPAAHEFLAREFHDRRVKKLYVAIVKGTPREQRGWVRTGLLRDPRNRKRFTWSREGGKPSSTYYRILRRYDGYSFLVLIPRTGRTHQIRVHCLSMGCPILGDPVYSRRDQRFPEATLMLHASRLGIHVPEAPLTPSTEPPGVGSLHPDDLQGRWRVFRASLPDRFQSIFKVLEKNH